MHVTTLRSFKQHSALVFDPETIDLVPLNFYEVDCLMNSEGRRAKIKHVVVLREKRKKKEKKIKVCRKSVSKDGLISYDKKGSKDLTFFKDEISYR